MTIRGSSSKATAIQYCVVPSCCPPELLEREAKAADGVIPVMLHVFHRNYLDFGGELDGGVLEPPVRMIARSHRDTAVVVRTLVYYSGCMSSSSVVSVAVAVLRRQRSSEASYYVISRGLKRSDFRPKPTSRGRTTYYYTVQYRHLVSS